MQILVSPGILRGKRSLGEDRLFYIKYRYLGALVWHSGHIFSVFRVLSTRDIDFVCFFRGMSAA